MRAAFAATLLLPLLLGAPAPAPSPDVSPTLADLAFMAGCWRGPSGEGTTIEEYYTAPADNLILGVSRYTKGAWVTDYEFSTIAREGAEIVLTPRPSGQEPAPFRLTRLDSTGAVWENPSHDFPTLISYRRGPADSLIARIEGPGRDGKRSMEWRMGPATCGR
jgi:Domain of unknown function (DUF6265)